MVPEERLNLAKVLLLQQIPLSESSVKRIAEGLISRTKDELPLDEPVVAARMYLTHAARGSSRICQVDSSTRLGTGNRGPKSKMTAYQSDAFSIV
jgi:hypothetical protein